MSKSNIPADDRLEALERRLAEMEATGAEKDATIAALLRGKDSPGADTAIERLLERLEVTDPAMAVKRSQDRLEAAVRAFNERIIAPYAEILQGAVGYVVAAMEPQRGNDSVAPAYPKPGPRMARYIFVSEGDGQEVAIAKYEKLLGIADPRIFGLGRYMEGTFPQAFLCSPQECEPIRKRCLELVAEGQDPDKIVEVMVLHGERLIKGREPQPIVETLGVA